MTMGWRGLVASASAAVRCMTAVAVVVAAMLLTGCGGSGTGGGGHPVGERPGELRVSVDGTVAEPRVDGVVGASASFGEGVSAVTITVEAVDGERIEFSTDSPVAPEVPPADDVKARLETRFTVAPNEGVEFWTPTTDVSSNYAVAWQEKNPVE